MGFEEASLLFAGLQAVNARTILSDGSTRCGRCIIPFVRYQSVYLVFTETSANLLLLRVNKGCQQGALGGKNTFQVIWVGD